MKGILSVFLNLPAALLLTACGGPAGLRYSYQIARPPSLFSAGRNTATH